MLPALKTDRASLADVMPACLAALSGSPNRLGLPAVSRAIVLLVDGLGAASLSARAGHARTLVGRMTAASVIESGFPTTTASALATLTTGVPSGQHGLVGYSVLDPENDRVLKQLSGWDDRVDPAVWQPMPTIFEQAVDAGFTAVVIGPERYRDSGFTAAVLRGATYLGAATIADRLERAAAWLREPGPAGIAYVYVPELDSTGHADGSESGAWTAWLETLDAAVATLVGSLRPKDGLLVTADHGVVDIPEHAHVLVDEIPGLLDGVRHIAGEPRCLQLHLEPGADADAVIERWRAAEDSRSWVVSREEAIAAGWFGPVRAEVIPRIGDIIVAARKNIAYYDGRVTGNTGRSMVGQHGSWSPAELRVPLLRYGAFANQ